MDRAAPLAERPDGVVDAAARMVRQRYGMASHFVT